MKKTAPYRRSKFEDGFEGTLLTEDIPYEYEPFSFKYKVEYSYTPDWLVGPFLLETKGVLDQDTRRHLKAFKATYPKLDLRLVLMRDNWLTKAKKMKYSDWCTRNGFKWCIGYDLPEEWKKEIKVWASKRSSTTTVSSKRSSTSLKEPVAAKKTKKT